MEISTFFRLNFREKCEKTVLESPNLGKMIVTLTDVYFLTWIISLKCDNL